MLMMVISTSDFALDRGALNQVMGSTQQVPVLADITLDKAAYRTAYTPFVFGSEIVGIVGTTRTNSVPFATQVGQANRSIDGFGVGGRGGHCWFHWHQ